MKPDRKDCTSPAAGLNQSSLSRGLFACHCVLEEHSDGPFSLCHPRWSSHPILATSISAHFAYNPLNLPYPCAYPKVILMLLLWLHQLLISGSSFHIPINIPVKTWPRFPLNSLKTDTQSPTEWIKSQPISEQNRTQYWIVFSWQM